MLLDKNFEPAKNLSLEELNEDTCKYMEGILMKKMQVFVEKKCRKIFLLSITFDDCFSTKRKKEDIIDKDEEMPKFIEKKIKSA